MLHVMRNGQGLRAEESAPLLVSAEAVAKCLDVSVRTLWRLRSSGKLPEPIRLGGSVRWKASDIHAWIDAGCPSAQEWEGHKAKDRVRLSR